MKEIGPSKVKKLKIDYDLYIEGTGLDTIRYQGLVAGDSFENTDDGVRAGARLMALVMLENMSVDDVKKSHPDLSQLADAYFPGGLFNGNSLDFWRQLGQTNFAKYWAKANARVLAVRGASDFVTYDADHKLIADIVNKVHQGWGESMVLPNSDHLFHNFGTEAESHPRQKRAAVVVRVHARNTLCS